MNFDPEKFLISGHGDNSLLICAHDEECEWNHQFAMAEPLSSAMIEAAKHTAAVHGVKPRTMHPSRDKPHEFVPETFNPTYCSTCWPRARRKAHAIHASSNRQPSLDSGHEKG